MTKITFDVKRYKQLQTLREMGFLDVAQQQELQDMAALKLSLLFEADVDLAAVFKREANK